MAPHERCGMRLDKSIRYRQTTKDYDLNIFFSFCSFLATASRIPLTYDPLLGVL